MDFKSLFTLILVEDAITMIQNWFLTFKLLSQLLILSFIFLHWFYKTVYWLFYVNDEKNNI